MNRGLAGKDIDAVVQCGSFVCSQTHKNLFEYIYYNYEDTHGAEWNYEMPAMSFELMKNNVVHWIPSQFNFCVSDLIATFYPFIFHETNFATTTVAGINAVKKKLGLSCSIPNNQRQALINIFDLRYFIHFAGCSNLMIPLYSSLPRE